MPDIAIKHAAVDDLDSPLVPIEEDVYLFKHFIVRSAGLPLDCLEKLALARATCAAQDKVSAAQGQLVAIVEQLETILAPTVRLKALRSAVRHARSDLKAGRVVRDTAREALEKYESDTFGPLIRAHAKLLRDHDDAAQKAALLFEDNFTQTRAALAAMCRTEIFQEALYLSNASLADNGSLSLSQPSTTRNSQRRRRERTATLYLQRLASKNETNARFGPINTGLVQSLTPDHGPARLALTQIMPEQRKGYLAHWLVQDIATAISEDPDLAMLVPLVGAGLYRQNAFRTLEGKSRHKALQDGVLAQTLEAAIQFGRLATNFHVPTDAVDQLAWLTTAVRTLEPIDDASAVAKVQWLDCLSAFDDDRQTFCKRGKTAKTQALENTEARYAAFCNKPVRRNAGRMFRTRTMLYEECHAGGQTCLSHETLTGIRDDINALTYACRAQATLRQKREMALALAFYDRTFKPAERVRFDRFLKAYSDAAVPDKAGEEECALHQAWSASVSHATRSDEWDLSGLHTLMAKTPLSPCFEMSPDLLFSAHPSVQGQMHVTLGEIHHGITMDGWMLDPFPEGHAISADIASIKTAQTAAQSGKRRMANLVLARHMKAAPQIYEGLVVELSGRAARPGQPPISLADLVVERKKDMLVLRVAGDPDPRPVMFHAPAFGYSPEAFRGFALFTAPILALPDLVPGTGTEAPKTTTTPQIATQIHSRLGRSGFTIYRRHWRLDTDRLLAIRDDENTQRKFATWRAALKSANVPRHTFVRSSSEPKPVFLDFDSPLLMEAVLGTVQPGDRIMMNEMLPGPDALWLSNASAAERTSEFRFLIIGGLNAT